MSKVIQFLGLALILLALGCAPHYIKPNMTERELARDTVECRREASIIAGEHDSWGVVYSVNFDLCMKGRGYTKVK